MNPERHYHLNTLLLNLVAIAAISLLMTACTESDPCGYALRPDSAGLYQTWEDVQSHALYSGMVKINRSVEDSGTQTQKIDLSTENWQRIKAIHDEVERLRSPIQILSHIKLKEIDRHPSAPYIKVAVCGSDDPLQVGWIQGHDLIKAK